MATVDHRASVATRKIGQVPGFEWYAWQCMDDPDGNVKLTGAVVIGMVATGKWKGRRKRYAPKSEQIAFVSDAEMLAERRRFEREEGRCAECGGDGQAFKSWDHIEGTKWRTCVLCEGSGKPKSTDAVDHVEGIVDTRPSA